MATTYQNWQNPSNTSEQYAVASIMLERAEADDPFKDAFQEFPHDANKGRSVVMNRWAVPATNTTPVSEGVNNALRNLVPERVYVTLSEYMEGYSWTSQAENMDPLDYAEGAAEVGYDLVKLDRNAIKWATMRSGSQRIFNSSTVTNRNGVNGVITAGRIDQAITILEAAKAKTHTDVVLGSNKIGSSGLQASYMLYGHTNTRFDLEGCRGYLGANNYPSDARRNPHEIGSLASGRVRAVLSSELSPFLGGGAAVGTANLRSTNSSIDVYPLVLVGRGALGCVPLRKKGSGRGGAGNMMVYHIKDPDRTDPGNLTRVWSVVWTEGYLILNELWLIRIEVACTNAMN